MLVEAGTVGAMESISVQRRGELVRASRDTRKLELHDHYGADGEDLKLFLAGDRCLEVFEAAYSAAVPHHEYRLA